MFIAFPVAWWAMNAWLNNFPYRVDIGADVFVIAGLFVMLITTITVSFQSVKVAPANTAKSLKVE